MAKLLEAYAKRVAVADNVYAKEHNGSAMSKAQKLTLACVLNNQNKFLTERFNNSVGTQRADIGNYKRFIMNLTNIAMPNLLADELVMVQPMTARSGFVTYIDYVAGSNKGGVAQGDVFNSGLYGLGKMDEARVQYTGAPIVEKALENGMTAWKPVAGKVEKMDGKDSEGQPIWVEIEVADIVKDDTIRYHYDNEVIPQHDLPIINAVTREIPLLAKVRRIAIYYSQLAEFEMKNQMGEDLAATLPEQAVAELKYEIDTEIVMFLKKLAGKAALEFNKTVPVGISMPQHYEAFLEVIEAARTAVYKKTLRYRPNYMICAADVLQVLAFCSGFKANNAKDINGPFVAGTLNGLKVVVSPSFDDGEFVLGVNAGKVSAAVYAPYMAIVPTMLLGFADGAMSQGFSTMYALEALNPQLLVAGKIVSGRVGTAIING